MKLLLVIYFLGIIACGLQGSEKTGQHHKILCIPASFLAALGGGLCRDLFILFVFPAAFTKNCLPDITVALCAGILYRFFLQKYVAQNTIKLFVIITDALGLGTFISLGINKALDLGTGRTIAFCCGIVTALGGGILSSLLCGRSIREVLTTGIPYRIITILGAFIYIYCLSNSINRAVAEYWLILYTLIFIPISSYDFGATLINLPQYLFAMLAPIPNVAMLYRLNIQYIYVPHSTLSLYSFGASYNVRNSNLSHINHEASLGYKLRCPRRFSRGR